MKREQELLYLMVYDKINHNKKCVLRIQELAKKIDIYEFIKQLKKNKCIPLISEYLDLFDNNYKIILQNEYQTWINRVYALEKMAKDISKSAKENNINIIEPKGFALAMTIYQDKTKRQFSDLDLIVPLDQMSKMSEVLIEKGYFHRHNGKIADICAMLEKHEDTIVYEIKFLNPTMMGYLVVEVKKASDAVSYSVLPFFTEDLKPLCMDDQELYSTFANEGLLLHLCSNIYTDHYKYEGVFNDVGKLRDFLDLYFFNRNVSYNHEKFYSLAKKSNLEKGIEFCKIIMKRLFHIDIFSDFVLDNNNISNFPDANTIIYGGKKKFFLELYRRMQNKKNEFTQLESSFSLKKVDIKVESNQKTSLIYFTLQMNIEVLENILADGRLYISFVSGLAEKDFNIPNEEIDLNTYYLDNYTFCIFRNSRGLQFIKDRIKMFSVYNQNISNEKLKGEKIDGLYDNDQFKWRYKFEIPDYFLASDIYINLFTDIRLLDDYYKHDEYLFSLGQPFTKIV